MTYNRSVWGVTGLLRVVLVVAVLLAPTAWVVQYFGAFPVPSVASSATAGALIVGIILAIMVSPVAIFRLVRTPAARTSLSYTLTGICLILLLLALSLGVAIVGSR